MMAELKPEEPAPPRKPRIALMGEFSAGKSTLANLLMHERFSTVQVTATQMPPVWYALGEGPAVRIAMDGSEEPLSPGAAGAVSIRNTRAIRKFVQADILEACDIIDMPGSSDPNITEDIWQSMLPLADAVIWCTPATQAWRQSEAAMWEEAPERLFPRSLLLITRIDKVLSEGDQRRVVNRVQREAGSMFREIIPVSLIGVRGADDDPETWRASGLEAVLDGLQEIIEGIEPWLASEQPIDLSDLFAVAPVEAEDIAKEAETDAPARRWAAPEEASPEPVDAAAPEPDETAPRVVEEEAPADRVVPRRVMLRTAGQGENRRPRRVSSGSLI